MLVCLCATGCLVWFYGRQNQDLWSYGRQTKDLVYFSKKCFGVRTHQSRLSFDMSVQPSPLASAGAFPASSIASAEKKVLLLRTC